MLSVQCPSLQHSFGWFLRKERNFRTLHYKKYDVNQSLLFLESHIHKIFCSEISACTPFCAKERFSYQEGWGTGSVHRLLKLGLAWHFRTKRVYFGNCRKNGDIFSSHPPPLPLPQHHYRLASLVNALGNYDNNKMSAISSSFLMPCVFLSVAPLCFPHSTFFCHNKQ